jgi:DNA-binding NarL/FixJ family response regulator
MLTMSAEQEHVVDAVLAGASGYLPKDAALEEIVGSIHAAVGGASWVSPPRRRGASGPCPRGRRAHRAADPAARLTERETQILRLIAEGKDNTEIGEELYISPRTVKNHISSLLAKLQIENRIQAPVYAVKRGLV